MEMDSWDFKKGIKSKLGKVVVKKDEHDDIRVAVLNKDRLIIFKAESDLDLLDIADILGFGDKEYRQYLHRIIEVSG